MSRMDELRGTGKGRGPGIAAGVAGSTRNWSDNVVFQILTLDATIIRSIWEAKNRDGKG